MAFLDETGLATLWGLIGEKYSQIAVGSYIGTGTHGEANKTSLTFGFAPKLLWVTTERNIRTYPNSYGLYNSFFVMTGVSRVTTVATYGIYVSTQGGAHFAWDGNTVSWYGSDFILNDAENTALASAAAQMNTSGTTYYYLAIG